MKAIFYQTRPAHVLAIVAQRIALTFLTLFICVYTGYGQTISVPTSETIGIQNGGTEVRHGLPKLLKPMPEWVYPAKAELHSVEGRVVARFVLSKKGRAQQIEILSGIGYGCDEEVVRVLRSTRFEPVRDEAALARPTIFVTAIEFRLDR